MIFHLGYELPVRKIQPVLDHESPSFTDKEVAIVKEQIRRNSRRIDQCLGKLDLFLNKEGHPSRESFVRKLRDKVELLIAENDTFRKVLWKHFQREEMRRVISGYPEEM